MAFIFGALLEFALVNYAARKDISGQQRLPRFRAQSIDTQGHYQVCIHSLKCLFKNVVAKNGWKWRSPRSLPSQQSSSR
jgi:hypothetical protein